MEINKEETKEPNETGADNFQHENRWQKNQGNGKVFSGLILIAIGLLFLARQMGAFIPYWIFSWPVLLIVIGFYIGVKHQFKKASGIILMLVGGAFLVRNFIPELNISNYIWPIVLIILGLYTILKPKKNYSDYKQKWDRYKKWDQNNYKQYGTQEKFNSWSSKKYAENVGNDYLEINSVFGNIKKIIITKDFKGGEVNCVFGGAEINLSQADFNGIITLEVNAVLGGVRIIVPPHWEIKSELTAVMGGADDKRQNINIVNSDPNKFLVLKGTALFGGIDIRSY